jgi:hypothetical protein
MTTELMPAGRYHVSVVGDFRKQPSCKIVLRDSLTPEEVLHSTTVQSFEITSHWSEYIMLRPRLVYGIALKFLKEEPDTNFKAHYFLRVGASHKLYLQETPEPYKEFLVMALEKEVFIRDATIFGYLCANGFKTFHIPF